MPPRYYLSAQHPENLPVKEACKVLAYNGGLFFCPHNLPSYRLQTSQRLTLQEKLVDKAKPYVHQPDPELRQGLWQLKEALCLLTVGA